MSYVHLGAATTSAAGQGLQRAFAILAQANADLAQILKPMHGFIDRLPYPATERFKQMMKEKPIDALVEYVTPWEDIAKDTLTLANKLSRENVRRIGLPPFRVDADMRWEWPDDAQVADYSLRVFIQRLRTVNNLMILFVLDPGHLSAAFAQTLARYTKQEVERAVTQAAGAGKSAADAAVRAGQDLLRQMGLGASGGDELSAGTGLATMLPSMPSWMATLDSMAHAFGAAISDKVVLALLALLGTVITAGATVTTATAPVVTAAMKNQQAQGQKNPYAAAGAQNPKVALEERAALVRGASAALNPAVPTWAIGAGIGALIVGAMFWRKK